MVTEPVQNDADDPAIWINKDRPEASLILATDKVAKPNGGLYVFDLNGRVVHRISELDRPNNVDVEYGFKLNDGVVDLAVVTERKANRLRIYAIKKDGSLIDVSGATTVFEGQSGSASEPMGIGLFKRKSDNKIFAIVGRKSGPSGSYLWQYELNANGHKIDLKKVREFGQFSGEGEIEAICVDDDENRVYYADEGYGIRIAIADPDTPNANSDLGSIATQKKEGDWEGIAVYAPRPGQGYLVITEQIPGNSKMYVYDRKPTPDSKPIAVIFGGADSTDGLDVASGNFGEQFPRGMLIAMNSSGKNFFMYDMRDVIKSIAKSNANSGSRLLKF